MKAATITPYVAGIVTCISIHAAREGGDAYACVTVHLKRISIHAAREGGDEDGLDTTTISLISIHAAREGGDVAVRMESI